ncbi:MAG: HAD-IC family P-type ATPase, partial [Clostridia bacterium]|nr:HAD-IC family P-type ATPase [Clostridia bacterium]
MNTEIFKHDDNLKTPAYDEEIVEISTDDDFSLNRGKGLRVDTMPVADGSESQFKAKMRKKLRHAKIPKEGTFEHFLPPLDKGLTDEQVKTRFKQFLFNDTDKKYSRTYFSIIVGNLCTFFNLLALLATLALIWAGAEIGNFGFVAIFLLNITIGIIQEILAKKKLDKLTIVTSPTAKVMRNGVKKSIPTDEIVVDDVIFLKIGQQIPADCVMCDGNMEVNEALLTGESVAIRKKEGDLLYAGSFVVSGGCVARVKTVGKATYANTLTAKAKNYKRPHSEIMHATNLFIRVIAVLMIPIAVGTFLITRTHVELHIAVQNTCAVVVGMIPSGMIFLTSAAMAMGMRRLAQNHTIVQDMYSLESLARVDMLCLDKTGTITDGRMEVRAVTMLNSYTSYSVDDVIGSMLASLDDNNQTSIALYNRFGHSTALRAKTVLPFSSARKFSAVSFHRVGTFALGAPEFVLNSIPERTEKLVREYAQQGLRVLVLA